MIETIELQRGRAGEDAEGLPLPAPSWARTECFNEAAPVKTRKAGSSR